MRFVSDIIGYIIDHIRCRLMALATDQHSNFHSSCMQWTVCTSLSYTVCVQSLRHVIVPLAKRLVLTPLPWEVVTTHCHGLTCRVWRHPHRECRKKQEDRDAGRKLNCAQPLGSRNAEKKQDADSGEAVALCVREARVAATTVRVNDERSDRLVFDNGATHNFVKDLSMLHDMRDSPIEMELMGGKEAHRVACAGTVVLHGGPNGPVTVKEALYVPSMHMNLLSGGYVTDKGGSYHGKDLHLTVHGPDDRVLLTGEKVEGLYLVDCHMVPTDVEVPTAYANAMVPAELMHRRLGHVGMGTLKIAPRAVTGMGDVHWNAVARREVCPLAKRTEEHFPRSASRATRPMELVHTDVMGPFPVLGMNDKKYVVTLMDD